jgi:hypothetical protein
MLHWPLAQAGVPWLELQAWPHPPHAATEVLMFTSQPLAILPSQLAKPALQVYWQAPAVQDAAVMFGGALVVQLLPQPPQLVRLVPVLISQPLPRFPSQLA